MAIRNNNIDNILVQAIKVMELEAENRMPNLEDAWNDFEKKIKYIQKKDNKIKKILKSKIALIACCVLLIITFQNKTVVAFRNEIFKWIGKDIENNTIIVEQKNPQVEEGIYTNLTFSEAQEKVIFHLVKPAFLPKGLNDTPDIQVNIYEYPYALVSQTYRGEGKKVLSIGQESFPEREQKNTFVPENVDIERINIKNKDIILVEQNGSYYAWWVDNGINYTINTINIGKDDLIRVIETLH